MGNMIKTSLLMGIRFYRFTFSLFLGHRCRFMPSCSEYAMVAIGKYGCVKGCYQAAARILRCHPWHPGGVDPVK